MSKKDILSLGFSPCPNDTFLFYALYQKKVPLPGPVTFYIEDIETLNSWALSKKLDLSKFSFGAFGYVLDSYELLPVGAALGFGAGPLILARKTNIDLLQSKIGVPGLYTTACLLLRLYLSEPVSLIPMRYDKIIPSLLSGKIDAGVVIHESRFLYKHYGLKKIEDLGIWWEKETHAPVPLGGLFIRKDISVENKHNWLEALNKSINYSLKHPQEPIPFIKGYAQELSEDIIKKHIATYVNEFSKNLGKEGLRSIEIFLQKAFQKGLIPSFSKEFYFSC